MKTRALYTYTDESGRKRTNVVWFGSTGIITRGFDGSVWDTSAWDDGIGHTIFYNDAHDSFSTRQTAVVDSLTQRLSIIKGELWYAMSYGIPLFEKNRSKVEFDAWILKTISEHPDVIKISSFTSQIISSTYSCHVKIQTKYGQIDLNL